MDVSLADGTAPVININEKWKFKVKVENTGHINMTDVSLRVAGSNGAEISTSLNGSYYGGLTTGSYTVNGGSSMTSSYFYFEAPASEKPANTVLVVAHVARLGRATGTTCSTHTPRTAATWPPRAATRPRFIRSSAWHLNADFRSRDGREERTGARHAAIPRARTLARPKARPGCAHELQPTYATHLLTLRSQRS